MEYGPRSEDRKVQRLRYQFRMSGHLQKAIRTFLIPEAPHIAVPFFSTKEVLTDELWTLDVQGSLETAKAYFLAEEERHPLYVRDTISITANKGLARIALRPLDQPYFDSVTAPLSVIPSERVQNSIGHYFYGHIDAALIEQDEQRQHEAYVNFQSSVKNETIRRHLRMERVKIHTDAICIPHD
jgi:hypothetical protein